jgi:FkbM family methyltransferase
VGLGRFIRRIWRHPSNRGRRLRALARACWWELTCRAPGRATTLELFDGLRLRCYPDSGVARGLVWFSGWPEYHEMRLVAHLLRPGDRFVDIGANVGYFTLLAASLVGPTGSVDAFEPGQPALDRLRENVAMNALPQVRVRPLALSDAAGEALLTTGRDTENRLATADDAVTAPVRAERLDAVLDEGPYAMAKADVEGAELRVLRGAERLLARATPPVWLLELREVANFGSSGEEIAAWLGSRGYDVGLYDSDARTFAFGGAPWTSRPNVVAVARSARAEIETRVRAADA